MCGIVAVFGNVTVNAEKAFKDMLIFDQVRGDHSTGMASVPKSTAGPIIAKAIGAPSELFDTGAYTKALAGSHRLLLGHNRYATQGKVNKANAHPFTCGSLTGVHNGSLRNYTGLDGYGQFDVDSQVLYNHIANHGLRDALEHTYGAMALVWWDENKETLNFYRNNQRPLWFASTEDRQMGFLASEPWMISVAAARNSIKVSDPVEVADGQWYAMPLPKNTYGVPLVKPTTTYLPCRVETFTSTTSYLTGVTRGNVNGGAAQQTNAAPRLFNPPAVLPKEVVVTYTGDMKQINTFEYATFFEESVEGSREFVLSKVLFDAIKVENGRGIAMGDSFRIDSTGYMRDNADRVRDPNRVYFLIHPKKMELVGTNFEYTIGTTMGDTKVVEEDAPPFEEDKYLDRNGKDIGQQAWERIYGTCSHCNGDVDHSEPYKFNTAGGIYCGECINDPVTADTLPR